MKILFVFGTRPEAIKMAPLVKEFEKQAGEFNVKVCVTGQHREMLDQVLDIFEIVPDYDLNIMKKGQDLYDVTVGVIAGMRDVLTDAVPDIVLVHGDTTTSTAAALAAFYKRIPVGHVEAGLRTHNRYNPWPEEMNRNITGRISSYHFAPTITSKNNLLREAIPEEDIFVTGNTVIDALHLTLDKIENNGKLLTEITAKLVASGISVNQIREWEKGEAGGRRLVLITGHRRENFGEGFSNICYAIKELAAEFPEVDFVYPVHLNPNVRKPVSDILTAAALPNIFIIEPLDYMPFVFMMSKSYLILTDSGGVQEEAPSLGKPVLVMRETTERPEAVEAGTVKLIGTDRAAVVHHVSQLLTDENIYNTMQKAINPYGDGLSSQRIVALMTAMKAKHHLVTI